VWLDVVATNLLDDPAVAGIVTHARDVTSRHRADALAADQALILEHVARGEVLEVVLGEVAEMVERWLPDTMGVVVTREGSRLDVAAAPHLGDECVAILERLEVTSPGDGRPDPRFCVLPTQDLRPYGYETSWAAAIGDGGFGALGAVIAYRRARGEPTPADRQLLELAGNVAGICIERGHAERRRRDGAAPDRLTGVRATDPTGLLIIRAWVEYGSSAPLRAELSQTSDVSNGIERQSVHSNVVEVGTEVQAWLREVLSGT
jgi:GAF domain-containing protein